MDEYTCAACGGTFEKTWSDEEALAETKALFGDYPVEDRRVVCEECFNAMKPTFPQYREYDEDGGY